MEFLKVCFEGGCEYEVFAQKNFLSWEVLGLRTWLSGGKATFKVRSLSLSWLTALTHEHYFSASQEGKEVLVYLINQCLNSCRAHEAFCVKLEESLHCAMQTHTFRVSTAT